MQFFIDFLNRHFFRQNTDLQQVIIRSDHRSRGTRGDPTGGAMAEVQGMPDYHGRS